MSLIQEALKRQHRDAASKAAEAATGSSTPPPVPDGQPQAADSAAASPLKFKPAKPAEEAGQGATLSPEAALIVSLKTDDAGAPNKKPFFRKPAVLVGAVVAGVVVLAVIGFVATKAVRTLLPNKSPSNEPAPPAAKAPETNKPAKPPKAAPAQSNAAAMPQSKPQVSAPKPAATTPGATAQKPPSAPAPATSSPSIAPPPVPKPLPKPEVAMWPILVIKGVLGKGSHGNGGAIINNEIVSVGGEIEGVKIVSVNPNGTITLEFKGEKKTLRSGDITQ